MEGFPTARELIDRSTPPPPPKDYLVTYRVVGDCKDATREERYNALVAELAEYDSAQANDYFKDEGHVATSSWTIRAAEQSAQEVVERLSGCLAEGRDLLEVVEIVVENLARF